jgi:hypothetical protein
MILPFFSPPLFIAIMHTKEHKTHKTQRFCVLSFFFVYIIYFLRQEKKNETKSISALLSVLFLCCNTKR